MQHLIAWVGALFLLLIAAWLVTVFVRVRRLRRAYRRILREPVAQWLPPKDSSRRRHRFPNFDNTDWSALSDDVDENGIYRVDYDAEGQRGVGGRQINPANVAVFGIRRARRYLEHDDERDLTLALRQFDFVERSARPVPGGDTVVWCADYDVAYDYNARAPWTGCYFHNFCLSALVWAYVLTDERRYLDLALRSLAAFELPVEGGGLSHITSNGGLFFEEIAAVPLHHILNGHLIALIGVYRFHEFTGSEVAKRIFDRGVRGAVEMLPRYDHNGYSLYSLSPHPPGLRNHFHIANPSYHHKHVALLETLHGITGEGLFKAYADRWRASSGSAFDVAWTAMFVVFKDGMKAVKRGARLFRR